MPLTLDEMATKGYEKLKEKATQMTRSWEATKDRMIASYKALPFGPTRKSNYEDRIRKARHRVDPEKWREAWVIKMSE